MLRYNKRQKKQPQLTGFSFLVASLPDVMPYPRFPSPGMTAFRPKVMPYPCFPSPGMTASLPKVMPIPLFPSFGMTAFLPNVLPRFLNHIPRQPVHKKTACRTIFIVLTGCPHFSLYFTTSGNVLNASITASTDNLSTKK